MEVLGSFSYSTGTWSRLVRLLEQGLLELDPVVTHRFPVDRFSEAFEVMDRRDGIVGKVLLEHAP